MTWRAGRENTLKMQNWLAWRKTLLTNLNVVCFRKPKACLLDAVVLGGLQNPQDFAVPTFSRFSIFPKTVHEARQTFGLGRISRPWATDLTKSTFLGHFTSRKLRNSGKLPRSCQLVVHGSEIVHVVHDPAHEKNDARVPASARRAAGERRRMASACPLSPIRPFGCSMRPCPLIESRRRYSPSGDGVAMPPM